MASNQTPVPGNPSVQSTSTDDNYGCLFVVNPTELGLSESKIYVPRLRRLNYHVPDMPSLLHFPVPENLDEEVIQATTIICVLLSSQSKNQECEIGSVLTAVSLLAGDQRFISKNMTHDFHRERIKLNVKPVSGWNSLVDWFNFSDPDVTKAVEAEFGIKFDGSGLVVIDALPSGISIPASWRNLTHSDILSFYGILLLLVFKCPMEQERIKWMRKHYSVLRSLCRGSNDNTVLNEFSAPDVTACKRIKNFYSETFNIRKTIFYLIQLTADKNTDWSKLCGGILEFLKGYEMGHFALINQYIVRNNPMLLMWTRLAPYVSDLFKALDHIEAFESDENNWPYIRILRPQIWCEFLFRKKFLPLIAVAQALKNEASHSSNNYQGANTDPDYRELIEATKNYINKYNECAEEDKVKETDLELTILRSKIIDAISTPGTIA